MYAAVVIIHVICSIALILIVLLQAGKGTGIANVFGGAGQTVFGARTGDVLARGTEVCAGLFMMTSLVLATMSSDRSSSVMRRRSSPMESSSAPIALPADGGIRPATMEKLKQAMAGITQTVKQAVSSTQTAAAKPARNPSAAPLPATAGSPVPAVQQHDSKSPAGKPPAQ